MNELIARLLKQSVCIHIAAEKECAEDVSDGLRRAADALEAQEKRIAELEREVRQLVEIRLSFAQRNAQLFERAEQDKERAEKAESSLRECMAHADAMSGAIDTNVWDAANRADSFRKWRAKR